MFRKLFWVIGVFIFVLGLIFFSTLFFTIISKKEYPIKSDKKVFIKKDGEQFTLIKDGKPFFIKGGSGYTNIRELSEIGGNTIRTWDTTNIEGILNEAAKYNIAVIVGLDMPYSGYNDSFYSDQEQVNNQYLSYKKIVKKYRNHPALLMWCLGNELDFHLGLGYDNFYKTFQNLLLMIKSIDPNHPITTTVYARGKKDLACFKVYNLDIDIVSLNKFGNLHTFKEELKKDNWLWEWPFLVTEWGYHGPWEKNMTSWGAPFEDNDSLKAARLEFVYQNYLPHEHSGFLGSLVFFWGQKQERTHTWFSLFDAKGRKTRSFESIEQLFRDSLINFSAPYITSLSIEGNKVPKNIILTPGKKVTANTTSVDPNGDSLIYKWEIYKEQWYYTIRVINNRPENYNHLITFTQNNKMEFITPKQDGPYRLFVYVYDGTGNIGTANVPFYILK